MFIINYTFFNLIIVYNYIIIKVLKNVAKT